VVDADLLQAPHPGLVQRAEAEADLRGVLAFGRHPRERGRRLRQTQGQRCRHARGPDHLDDVSAFHGRITVPSRRLVVPHE
jgi:hypothetical protein